MHGYDVFFDYQSIDSGKFESVILDNIRARAHFIVILTPSALENCPKPGDWLRREIETALDENRNIVPLMVENFDFGSSPVKEALTGKLSTLKTYNGLSVPNAYALEAMERLRERYLKKALSDVPTPPLQLEAQKITETQKSAANEAPPVQEEQLTAQTWFERGFQYYESKNFDEAVRCNTEAIRFNPGYAFAHFSRGYAFSKMGDLEKAISNYDKAIELAESDITYRAAYYAFRGNAYLAKDSIDSASADLNEAIFINPDYANGYSYRGAAHCANDDIESAIADYAEAIRIQPDNLYA
jgi:tetratricopeptide (TPR) repeat protein